MLASAVGVTMLLGQTIAPPDPCEALRVAVQNGEGPLTLRPAIVEAPSSCVPAISALLESRGELRFSAAWALSYMANADGQDALYGAIARRPHFRLEEAAAVGAAVVARPRDLEFLCKVLGSEGKPDDWPAAEAAALSVGLLRWAGCNVPLAHAAQEKGTLTGGAARYALALQGSPHPCRAKAGEPVDALLKVVLDCGVPSSERATAYFDWIWKRVWTRGATGWTSRTAPADEETKLPRLTLAPIVATKGALAIVQVMLSFGPLDSIGYDYLLRREGEWWVVRGIRRTEIS